MAELRDAEYVIIGGGIIGCSIAYHLTAMGKTDVLIVEKSDLTHGATWHAAGLVGQLRSSKNTTRMLQKSVEVYDSLEAETGQAIDWKKYGSLRLACSEERMKELRRMATTAKSFGLELEIISPDEAQKLFPLMSTEDVIAAAYIPSDGYIDPSSVCQALAAGARKRGAEIVRNTRVTGFQWEGKRITHVETDKGTIKAGVVINTSGMWGREVGKLANARVPACALEHQYLITDPLPDAPKNMPTLRDPDLLVYYKPEVRGLVIGGYEENTLPFGDHGIRRDFGQELLPDNFDRFSQLAELGAKRTPILNEVGVRQLLNGPIPYSADGDFVMGRQPEWDNMFVASGFLYGIAAGGGAGRMMAEWIVEGRPSLDLWPLDIRRFGYHHGTRWFMYPRAIEMYGKHYKLHPPGTENQSARGVRRSPLHEHLKANGAVFGSRGGWERPLWFAPEGVEPKDINAFDRREANWFKYVGEEHKAVRENVALIDQTSFAKFELRGPGTLAALQKITACNMDRPVGSVLYTQMLNERGGIECDLTLVRLGVNHFYGVTGSTFGTHDMHWMAENLPGEGAGEEAGANSVILSDITSARAVLNICGPNARKVLEKVVEEDISNDAFPFATARQITVGAAPVLAVRIGYVGELGWELHIPTEFAAHVYEVLRAAGAEFGIRDVGYRAIDTLRMEKGYVYWSADVTPDVSPIEAGLGFRVHLKAKDDFIGRPVMEKQRAEGVSQKLCTFVLDKPLPVYGGEAILLDGKVVGHTTSGNYGHTVGASIAMGLLSVQDAESTEFEIEVFGERSKARRHDGALYDPEMARLKA